MGRGSLVRGALLLAIVSLPGIAASAAEESKVVTLTKFNFDRNVKQGAWFVKFYAPWCVHCKKLAPIWQKLADHADTNSWPVKIAEVDCTVSKDVCEKVHVKAFPMLGLIKDGILKGKYQGEASLSSFEEWLGKNNALKAGSSAAASATTSQNVLSDEPTGSSGHTSATSWQVLTAIISNTLARFPTKSKIVNVYFFGVAALVVAVSCLCLLFSFADQEDRLREENEKDD